MLLGKYMTHPLLYFYNTGVSYKLKRKGDYCLWASHNLGLIMMVGHLIWCMFCALGQFVRWPNRSSFDLNHLDQPKSKYLSMFSEIFELTYALVF